MNTPFQPIEWTDQMVTGIAAIDRQHHYLVDTMQNANDKLLHDHDGILLHKISMDLLGYAITHFETEEALMQRYGYQDAHPDEARNHIFQHREFSQKVVAICDRLREGREVSSIEVLAFLNDWLQEHLLGVDQQYCDFLRKAMGIDKP